MARDDERPGPPGDDGEAESIADAAAAPAHPRWRRPRLLAGLLIVLLVALTALAIAWLSRERLARAIIAQQLDGLGLPATYRIVSIGPTRQVLADIAIGDRTHPDLTVARAELGISLGFGGPSLGRITLLRPRLYGRYRAGKLSFGSLDKLLFSSPGTTPFRLPDLDLALDDARARGGDRLRPGRDQARRGGAGCATASQGSSPPLPQR